MDFIPDEQLIGDARAGSIEAFEKIFDRYKKQILNYVYRFIGNRETAEDVTQEAFIKAYRNLDLFDPQRKFSSWIYAIARNLAKNALRDKKYFRDISLDTEINEDANKTTLKDLVADSTKRPDILMRDAELQQQVEHVLNSLPVEFREIITLCCIQNMHQRDVAKIIGCSVSTVSLRLEKAKQAYRCAWKKQNRRS